MAKTPSSRRHNASRPSAKNEDAKAPKNKLLLALPPRERDLIFSHLTLASMKLHDLLQEAGEQIKYAYFPDTAMASVLNIMADGKSVEVGLVGREGFVGAPLIAGFRSSSSRVVIQAAGTIYRMNANDLRKALPSCPHLAIGLIRYSQEAAMEVTQIAACNRLHEVSRRLARWLLMSQDRICADPLPLTQEFLAEMLGIRRSGVSVAASVLQKAGIIKYRRGSVSILDRKRLEAACCECYAAIRQQLDEWHRESR